MMPELLNFLWPLQKGHKTGRHIQHTDAWNYLQIDFWSFHILVLPFFIDLEALHWEQYQCKHFVLAMLTVCFISFLLRKTILWPCNDSCGKRTKMCTLPVCYGNFLHAINGLTEVFIFLESLCCIPKQIKLHIQMLHIGNMF